jgi:hypothetical protein
MHLLSTIIVTVSLVCLTFGQATTQPSEAIATAQEKLKTAEATIALLSAKLEDLEKQLEVQADLIKTLRSQNEDFAFQIVFAQNSPLYEPRLEDFTDKKLPVLPSNPKAAPAAGDDTLKSEFVSIDSRPDGKRIAIRLKNVSEKRIESIKGLIEFQNKDGGIISLSTLAVELKKPIGPGETTSFEGTWHSFDDEVANRLENDPRQIVLKWGTYKVTYAEERGREK